MSDVRTTEARAELDRLADEMFQRQLAWAPLYASQVGYGEYAAELPDVSLEAEERRRAELVGVGERAAAVAPDALDSDRQITRQVLLRGVADALTTLDAKAPEYTVTPLPHTAPASTVMVAFPKATLRTNDDAEGYLQRCLKVPRWLTDAQARLDAGRVTGRTPVARLVEAAIGQLDTFLATPIANDPIVGIAAPADGEPSGWRERVAEAVRDHVRPALAAHRDYLRDHVLPTARPDTGPGVGHLDGGVELYQKLAAGHTTTDRIVEELHQLGLDLVAKLTEEMRERGAKALHTSDFAAITNRLRTDDDLRFDDAEQMLAEARGCLARAEAELPNWLRTLPRVGCEVLEQATYEAESGNLGYYQWPSVDGSRPGRFWLNTLRPTTRPRYELQALTFHESVPGHHTQLALLWELPDLCDYRRHARATAFTEGWALYTERLADEMGLYTDDVAKLGMVSFDFWRACRLVVDTGMHAFGWTRERAVRFMSEHSALTHHNIENEVDRYIAWPGQALAYMVGKLEIERLRRTTSERLGPRFVLRDFHDAVLGQGNLPLSVLAGVVDGL